MNSRGHLIAGLAAVWLVSCSGSGGNPTGTDQTGGCSSSCVPTALTQADVEQVIAQGVAEAQAYNAQATIAVVDRVGNVLAVYRMGTPAEHQVVIATALDSSGKPVITAGLEGIRLPVQSAAAPALAGLNIDDQAAIAKAVTGAYLSSEGNAFSTRTASQIVQQHFNPGELSQPSGPLFGVQFSQFACSDFIGKFNGTAPDAGPKRSPLGLSADPGGFPLYKNGTVVGGVGVLADGQYGIDADISNTDANLDEEIAYGATYGYAAPLNRRADQITAGGRLLRFSDVDFPNLAADPAKAPPYAAIPAGTGALIQVTGYSDGTVHAGTAFGDPASGITADTSGDFTGENAFIFVDNTNTNRFPAKDASDGAGALTQAEVLQLLKSALDVANRARGQIRLPVGDTARVTIAVVDRQGATLGMVRSADAPVFGSDVSLQKARAAAFFSSDTAASYLSALPDAKYLTTDTAGIHFQSVPLGNYVTAFQSFGGNPTALADGAIAYSDRAIGNLARPFFPDGIDGSVFGPLSKPQGQWSVFSTGLQLDLSINAVLQHVLYVANAGVPDVTAGCTGIDLAADLTPTRVNTDVRLGNGLQIFPGSVPIYRGNTLVGAIGVSGDGVDQDDMVAFLGLANASRALGGSISNAPSARRADTLTPQGTRLKYVQCPQSPFVNSNAENVCAGL
ncbi:MAG TPA: heme-binding protein [Steroidobacteraceae bacterium]|nr:heme-binding protein [Steroidobacteraceae bacterium]